ncbi:MAG: ABC transporter permease [Lachnospiraceae bacterium]|nr:ABC transporter permease [Lachnospiraceae bacterium]
MKKFYFENARYNLLCHKRNTLRILINLMIISMLLVAWLSLRTAIGKANEKYMKGYRSACTFPVDTEQDEDGEEIQNDRYWILSDMDTWEELSKPIRYAEMDLNRIIHSASYVRTSNQLMTMICDDQVYQGINDNSFYPPSINTQRRNSGQSIDFRVGLLISDTLFSGACLEEYQYKNKKDTPLLIGREPLNENEIMLSDFMMRKFGVLQDAESFVGKTVSFIHKDGMVLDHVTIVGIIDGEYFREYGTMYMPQIWLRENNELLRATSSRGVRHCYTVDAYKNYDTVVERYAEKIDDVENWMFYGNDVYIEVIAPCNEITSVDILVNKIGTLFGGLIILSLLIHLYNIFTQRALDRMNYNGILRAMGMRRGGIFQIGFCELFYIAFVAVAIGVSCSAGLIFILNEYVGSLLLFRLELNALDFVGIAAAALSIQLLLMFFMQYIILHKYLRKQPIELLRA